MLEITDNRNRTAPDIRHLSPNIKEIWERLAVLTGCSNG